MVRIGLLSDTHSFLDDAVFKYFDECDEIWNAGDIGNPELIKKLGAFKPTRAVYGNIDGAEIRSIFPEVQYFMIESVKIIIIHIGGYPPKYNSISKPILVKHKPTLFICGHSHIAKAMYDQQLKLLHLNPGAAGKEGFHLVRTLMRFNINEDKIEKLEVIELAKR